MNQRKGAWSFRADWTFPGDGDTPSDLQQLDAKLRLLPLVAERIPHHLINMELKYKLSDWELARTKKTYNSAGPRLHPDREESCYRFR